MMIQEEEARNLNFTPDLHATLKIEKNYKFFHNGKWGVNGISKDKEAWSCCMNEEKESEV